MRLLLKRDPGPCPVDDCPHHTCVNPASPTAITQTMLPARDGAEPWRHIGGTPGPHSFTTKTYRRAVWAEARKRAK